MIANKNLEKALHQPSMIIGGVRKTFKFNHYGLARLQKETGKNPFVIETWQTDEQEMTVSLLWAGLITDEPEITIEKVSKDLSWAEMKQIPKFIQEVFESISPDPDEKKTPIEEKKETKTKKQE